MRDLGGVLVGAGRLLLRHWPALLTLGLVAAALRSAAVWGATAVSDTSGQLAQVLLLLAPMGYLLPFIAMLLICRGSLPGLSALDRRPGAESLTEHGPRRLVDVAVSVLVPFLAVYQAYGLLEDDIARFRNQAAFDEANQFSLTGPVEQDYAGRLGVLSLHVALLVVLVAWILRWGLGRAERATGLVVLAFVGALIEVYYTAQLAGQAVVFRTDGVEWLQQRVAVQWFEDAYGAVLAFVGPLANPLDTAVDAGRAVLSSTQAVVVVPVAFLVVAAVVLGHALDDDEQPEQPGGEPRGVVRSIAADVRARFSALITGLRLLGSAGLAPMLALCLALVVVSQGPVLARLTTRHLIGPVRTEEWYALYPVEDALAVALTLTLTVPLLAAAVEWLVVRRRRALTSPAVTAEAAPRSPAAPTTPGPA